MGFLLFSLFSNYSFLNLFLFHPIRKIQNPVPFSGKACHQEMPPHEIKSCVLGRFCCSLGSFTYVQSGCEVLSFSTKQSGHTSESRHKFAAFKNREPRYHWSSAMESNIPPIWKIYTTRTVLVSLLISDTPSDDFSLPAVVMDSCHKTHKIKFTATVNLCFTPHIFIIASSFFVFSDFFFTSQQYLSK